MAFPGTRIVHDRERARTRYTPASTFKIPNSLIGLANGVVANVDQVLPYGGQPTRRPEWAQDMSLRDAIEVSNVPVYQGLARRIGLERMREGLQALHIRPESRYPGQRDRRQARTVGQGKLADAGAFVGS